MMIFVGIDVGSSSVKAQLFRNGEPRGQPVRVEYPTNHAAERVEIEPDRLLGAVANAIADLPGARRAECVGLSVMSPAWVAMDKRGRAITPIVTHQDRRSIPEAREIERRVGRERHLRLAGNRPFPGGISSTTAAWFVRHEPRVMARADLVGHLNTFLHRRMTGARVIDTSNASFTGLYLTCEQTGWSEALCAVAGISRSLLPEVVESNVVAGKVTAEAARWFGLREGTPVMAGMVDTSAAFLLTGARPGQLLHLCGSTDVLAVVCDEARPSGQVLTRALGIGRRWTSAATIAAAGSALDWMHAQFFRDISVPRFHAMLKRRVGSPVRFDPYLAGERTSIEQKQAAFWALSLASTREEMLSAVVEALVAASAGRLEHLAAAAAQRRFLPEVYVSGGGAALAGLMRRDWPAVRGRRFREVVEAPLRGLATLTPGG
jgi:sugar (pentulose or hexulose) kinase